MKMIVTVDMEDGIRVTAVKEDVGVVDVTALHNFVFAHRRAPLEPFRRAETKWRLEMTPAELHALRCAHDYGSWINFGFDELAAVARACYLDEIRIVEPDPTPQTIAEWREKFREMQWQIKRLYEELFKISPTSAVRALHDPVERLARWLRTDEGRAVADKVVDRFVDNDSANDSEKPPLGVSD